MAEDQRRRCDKAKRDAMHDPHTKQRCRRGRQQIKREVRQHCKHVAGHQHQRRPDARDITPAQQPDQHHRHHRGRQRRAGERFRHAVPRHDKRQQRLACRHREGGKVGTAENKEGKPQTTPGLTR